MNLFLALQVWDLVGWAAQALFFVRVYHQWLLSEKAGRSLVPTAYWWYSVVATLCLIIYQVHRKDPVFLAGALINGSIYVRNLVLTYRPREKQPTRVAPWGAMLAGGAIFGGLIWLSVSKSDEIGSIVSFEGTSPYWLAFGFLAQGVWSSRFVVQWIASERAGASIMPASFFRISIVGAIGLFTYAVYRVDWVMMAAYLLNPIPFVRNLMLLKKQRLAAEAEAQEEGEEATSSETASSESPPERPLAEDGDQSP